jgi:hypothetical protein
MPIDAKATLNEQSLKKALKRLENSIHFINDWLGGDLSETFDWKILPALYFDRKSANFDGKFCQSCNHYIIQGKCIDAQLKNMFSKITPSFTGNQDMTKIEFMKLSSYLLFLVSFEPIVTPSKKTQLKMLPQSQINEEKVKSVEVISTNESTGVRRRPNWSHCDSARDLTISRYHSCQST